VASQTHHPPLRYQESLVASIARRVPAAAVYALVLAYAAMLLVPLYYTVISSFKTNQTIFTSPLRPPSSLSFARYEQAQSLADLDGALLNSVLITAGAELLTLLLAIPAAYGIARIPSRLSDAVERFFGVGFLIPVFAVLVPTFLFAVYSGLLYSRLFLVLFYPATALPLSVLLLAQFMRTIPRELEEAAAIDGARRLTIMRKVILPLSVPGVVTVVILNFLTFWNEYLFALVLTDENTRTAQVAVPLLRDPRIADYALLSAGVVITLAPVYLVYVLAQRRMQEALLAGAVKG
jgi:multiple sugar transport system permease protein